MLILPIKKKWFNMILSGEKKEEYREIKPYYTSRIRNLLDITDCDDDDEAVLIIIKVCTEVIGETRPFNVMFRNGYSKASPSFVAKCTLSVGKGKEEWGAKQEKEYYRFHIKSI